MLDLSTLNENQLAAVNWNEGPLLVLAGPGSGKTKVLTVRVARLILESKSENFKVLGLTFTNKAASEMRTRIDGILGEDKRRAFLCTFHAFCTELLRQHGSHIGLKPDFTILNQPADREAIYLDVINELKSGGILDGDVDEYQRYFSIIDRLLSNCVKDEDVSSWISRDDVKEKIKLLFVKYKQALLEENKVDFPSIIYFANSLLSEKPRIAKQVRTIYPYICVDEFQDTNLAQYKILKQIAGNGSPNLFVVADDDQIIYQWNGASPERLESLKSDYQMEVIQLPANYRCPPQVIFLANNLIQKNINRSPGKKPLVAMKEPSNEADNIRLQHFASLDKEIEWLAQDILKRPSRERGGIAVLARTTKILQEVSDEFSKQGIENYIVIRKNDFDSAPLQWMQAVLRLTNTRGDREQLRRVCKNFFKLEGVDIRVDEVESEATLFGGDFMRTWFEIVLRRSAIEEQTRKFLSNIKKPILDKMDFRTFVDKSFEWFQDIENKFSHVKAEVFADYQDEKKVWLDLQSDILLSHGSEETTLNVLLQELDLAPKTSSPPQNAVQCLTIHSSKGMEFEHVYLMGLVEDQLPSFQSIKNGADSREMQEERRNCFVAITRAQSTLTLTYSDKYFGWQKQPSRFLKEMGLLV